MSSHCKNPLCPEEPLSDGTYCSEFCEATGERIAALEADLSKLRVIESHGLYELCLVGKHRLLFSPEKRQVCPLCIAEQAERERDALLGIARDAEGDFMVMSSADGSGHADLGRRIHERIKAALAPKEQTDD